MYYVALFEHTEYGNALSDEKEARDDGVAIFQAIVKAKDIDTAEKKFREMLLQLRNNSDIFYDVDEIFLHSIAEIGSFPNHAIPLQWISFRLFGSNHASLSTILSDENNSCINYYDFESDEDDDQPDLVKPFIDFEKERRPNDPLYKSLLRRKNRGEELSLADLSDGDLYTLFVIEDHLNSEIASLFNANPSTVASRRKRIGATMDEAVEHKMLNDPDFIEYATKLIDNINE